MTCQTCKGAGAVPGHWTAELCPACGGACDVPLHSADTSIPWAPLCLAALALVGLAVAQWALWALIFPGVFRR